VRFNYELEQEGDGRWLVEILELPGCMAYGSSADDALRAAQVLAFRILADRLEHREQAAVPDISFIQARLNIHDVRRDALPPRPVEVVR
jgi:predicted RNase H-like HicB family nuclease